MLIAIEGINGCGKTRLATALSDTIKCKVVHFPFDEGYTGTAIRDYLSRKWHVESYNESYPVMVDDYGPMAFQALQTVNRIELLDELSKAQGSVDHDLVLSRYWQSGWVYGQVDGLKRDWLDKLSQATPYADVNILLDLPPETAFSRRLARDGRVAPDRYEEKLEINQASLYRELWDSHAVKTDLEGLWIKVSSGREFHDVLMEVSDKIKEFIT